MKKETARKFWRRYLNLVCGGEASLSAENPVCGFTLRAKAGEYDSISDEEYDELIQEHEEYRAIWSAERLQTAGEILLNALRMTKIDRAGMESIVEALAESSARSNYLCDSDHHDRGPLLQKIHTGHVPGTGAIRRDRRPSRAGRGPEPGQ